MRNPDFQRSLVRFAVVVFLALPGQLWAESPGASPNPNANKAVMVPRTRPQVIYHVRRASNYAATLHSQAKTPNNDLPIDDNMPTSLQLSRSNANAAAAEARTQAEQEAAVPQRKVKRAKPQKHQFMRAPGLMKSKGRGNSHGHRRGR